MVNVIVGKVVGRTPDRFKAIRLIEGTDEILKDLKTNESKVAYNIRMISVQLYKASKSIDRKNLSMDPNDLPYHILRSNKIFSKSLATMDMANLGDLEDLYYAICGKLKELLGLVNLHLQNNFKVPGDKYFTYTSEAYKQLGPIMVGEFKAFLLAQEEILYSTSMQKMMDKAVRKKNRQEALEASGQGWIQHSGDTLPGDVRYFSSSHSKSEHRPGGQKDIGGLRDVREQPCGMIFGELAEKYRSIIYKEKLEDLHKKSVSKGHNTTTKHNESQSDSSKRDVSPYNLNERSKRLNLPGGAEIPCICDPECICVPLCAADLSQNCLCEENGIFCRVTEGCDIDYLNMPDMEIDQNWELDNKEAQAFREADNDAKKKWWSNDEEHQTCRVADKEDNKTWWSNEKKNHACRGADTRDDKNWSSNGEKNPAYQETDNKDESTRISSSPTALQASIYKPTQENDIHVSQRESSYVMPPKSQKQNCAICPAPQYRGSLSIWATSPILGPERSRYWYDMRGAEIGQRLPPDVVGNSIHGSPSPRGNGSTPGRGRTLFPFARRFFNKYQRGPSSPQDILPWIRMSDHRGVRQPCGNLPMVGESEEIVFNGVTYVVRMLS